MKSLKLVSFIIPCYRSERTIEGVVGEIDAAMAGLPDYGHEVILVNDASPDGTFAVIAAMAERRGDVIAVDLAKNFGQHAALMAGMRHCRGDYIVCMDDDGQTPADEVGKLLIKLDEGYDVVYASYDQAQQNGFRRFGSGLNALMTEMMLGKPRELSLTSYFAAKRFIVEEMLRYEHGFPYVMGLVLRSTRNICNVPVHHRQREQGSSGYSLGKLIALWMNGFTSFSIKPLRLATYFGALTALAGFVYAIVIIVRHFVAGLAPMGWSSTTALLLIIGGIILLVLGLVGEYVGRIFMCINASPQYVERTVIGADK